MSAMRFFPPDAAPCRANPAVWDGEDYLDILTAIEGCQDCPALVACGGWAASRDDLVGVVAGHPRDVATRERFGREGRRTNPRYHKPIVHGTEKGASAHYSRGERPCEECAEAKRAIARTRYAARKTS